jgi:transcriptional regulator
MYLPNHFAEARPEVLHALIQQQPLGTLVIVANGEASADELPFVLNAKAGPLGVLQGHLARANALSNLGPGEHKVLVIFRGPQAYISPNWYPSKAAHGKAVPTWNYVTVQATGRMRVMDGDAAWLRNQLGALTDSQETGRTHPWRVDDAPGDYLVQMMRAIVGIEITIDTLVGKWKVSQNRDAADRAGVVTGLTHEHSDLAHAMARLIPD